MTIRTCSRSAAVADVQAAPITSAHATRVFFDHVVNPSHGAARQRGESRSVPEAPALCCGKHVAYRTENGALYGRPNGMPCRQRLQRLEAGASLAFILARVAAWVGRL